MKAFFDTSVLIAASVQSHPHHTPAESALRRAITKKDHGFMGTHSIAEIYASLTRLPIQPRVHPDEAARIINDNILPHFETVPATTEDYLQALSHVSQSGWLGAKIYDTLLLIVATKCKAERIYTLDLDFERLAPADLQDKICAP